MQSYQDLCVQKELDLDMKTLTFTAPLKEVRDIIVPEGYIETKEDRFVVKQTVPKTNGTMEVTATLDVEALEGSVHRSFQSSTQTIEDCLQLAFAGTGWTVASSEITKRRTISMTNVSAWEVLEQALSTYRAEIKLDSKNQKVYIYEERGEDRGAYFSSQINLKNLEASFDSYDFYTELEAYGKDGMTFANINDGNNYVTNYQYSSKSKRYIWKDERYTIEESLLEDAIAKLEDMSKPYTSYSAEILDLAAASGGEYSILEYDIGDTVTILDGITGTKEKQRIVAMKQYPEEPDRNSCTLSNLVLTFDEAASKYESTSDTVDNITNDNGTVDGDAIDGIYSDQIYDLETAVIGEAVITDLIAQYVEVTGELTAVKATIGELEANVATIDEAMIGKLDVDEAYADFALITDLEAVSAQIGVLEADYANIESLLAGNAGIGDLQTIHLTVDNTVIDSALIREAVIQNITANDILAGRISTDEVIIASDDGGLTIDGNTMQFTDADGTVRIQIGQDANGDFTFVLYDETGTGVLIDSEGIKASAIADGLIVNDMVSENANISGSKLDIVSLFEEMNDSTEVLYSSRIWFDEENQSLTQIYAQMSEAIASVEDSVADVEDAVTTVQTTVTSIETSIDGINVDIASLTSAVSEQEDTLNAQQTSISVLQGNISAIISESELTEVSSTTTMYSKLAALILEVDSLTVMFSDLETVYDDLSGQYTEMDSRLATFELSLDGITATVSSVQTTIDSLEVGGRNLLLDSNAPTRTAVAASENRRFQSSVDSVSVASSSYLSFSDAPQGITYGARIAVTTVASSTGTWFGFVFYNTSGPDLTDGETYTASWYARCTSGTARTRFTLYSHHSSNGVLTTSDWERYSFTFTFDDSISSNVPYAIFQTDLGYRGTIEMCGFKLEKGTVATDWTPAPEDTDAEIASVDVRVTEFEVTLDGITATVSSVQADLTSVQSQISTVSQTVDGITATVSSVQADLTDLEEWQSEASLKITDSSIISTVIESSSYESSVESIIEQNASSIRLRAATISWESTYSSMTESGTLTAQNVELYGVFHSQNGSDEIYLQNAYARFIRGGYEIGNIGTNNISGYTSYRGLVFDLESLGSGASYMGFAARESSSDDEYTLKLYYWNRSSLPSTLDATANAWNCTADIDMRGNDLLMDGGYITDARFTDVTASDGYTVIDGYREDVVCGLTGSSSSGYSWTNVTLRFRHGICTAFGGYTSN